MYACISKVACLCRYKPLLTMIRIKKYFQREVSLKVKKEPKFYIRARKIIEDLAFKVN